MDGPVQLVHGLTLRSDVPVSAAERVDDGAIDFEVRLEPPTALSSSTPAGQPVAALDRPGAGYAAALRDDLLTVRFYETLRPARRRSRAGRLPSRA